MEIPNTRRVDRPPPGVDETELVSRLKDGDDQAFADVVRAYGGQMLTVARRFLIQEQDAQDVVQDAFVSAFRSIGQFQQQSQLATWLHRIVVNAALMKLRRSQRRSGDRPIEELLPRFKADGHLADSAADWAVTLDTAVSDRETRDVVRRSIEQLPDNHRAVLLLRDIEGHSTEEAAELLGITSGAVKTRLHRARQALRTLLDPYMRGKP